jgi:hypothetical protein
MDAADMTNSQSRLLSFITSGSIGFFNDLSAILDHLALQWFQAGKTEYAKSFAECAALIDQVIVKVSALEEEFKANDQSHQ